MRRLAVLQSLVYSYKYIGPVYIGFSGLSPIMLACIVCRDIFLNYFPGSAHRAVVATGNPQMVTAPFLKIGGTPS